MQVVYITALDFVEAEALAMALIEEKLVACVNLFDNVSSLYAWQGRLVKSKEVVMIAKTSSNHVSAVIARVEEMHSYSCPCVFAIEASKVSAGFLNWVNGM